jgi:Bacterial EndoU nuclease
VPIDDADPPDAPDNRRPPDSLPPPDAPSPSLADPADRVAIHHAYQAKVDRIYAAHRDRSPDGTDRTSSGVGDAPVTSYRDRPDPDSITITSDRATHILDGDKTGGGHRAGTGIPRKTEFPAEWEDDKILGTIKSVARDPDVKPDEPQSNGRWLYEGMRDGVHTYVVVNPDGTVWTAWPREGDPGVIKNPRRG